MCSTAAGGTSRSPKWIKPQLTRLVDEAPGVGWVHEIKYDSYRMHARIDSGQVKLLTRTGLDWSLAIDADRGTWLSEGEAGLLGRRDVCAER
jgi:bifunctional non-homologous end joining protein LigD